MTIDIESGKPVGEIEADIAHTRAELSETLHALEERLTPQRILDRGFEAVRETVTRTSSDIGEKMISNPAPAALIALGVGWLLASRAGKAPNPASGNAASSMSAADIAELGLVPGDRWGDIVRRHPLSVGAIGLALGALAAFLLPSTSTEDQWIGEASDEVKREAQSLSRQAMDRAQQAAETAARDAVSAAADTIARGLRADDRI